MAIACSLMVILKKNPVASAFSLVLVFFSFAGIYALLSAHLIAGLQVLVYTGAIMVLFVFIIMLLNADVPSFDLGRQSPVMLSLYVLASAALLGLIIWTLKGSEVTPVGPYTLEAVEKAGGNTKVISEIMFNKYIFPFELTSVLLLAVAIGIVAIAMRKKGLTQ